MKKRLVILFLLLAATPADMLHAALGATSVTETSWVQAPFRLTVLKQPDQFLKRCFDLKTSGRFVRYKIEFQNLDKQPHTIDYSCFYLADTSGCEYEVHTYLTVLRQQRGDDWKMRENPAWGFNQRKVNPQLVQTGWLIFEVPCEGNYQLKFRGYLSY